MNKSELIELVAGRAPHVSRRTLEKAVNTVFELMGNALKTRQRIEIRGFGTFSVRTRGERSGRNPKTGAKVTVPSRQVLNFLVGKELKDRLNPLEPSEAAFSDAPSPL